MMRKTSKAVSVSDLPTSVKVIPMVFLSSDRILTKCFSKSPHEEQTKHQDISFDIVYCFIVFP
jgi:hypothetical protein